MSLDAPRRSHSLLWFLTMLRLDASTPREALLTASRGRIGFLYIHSPPSTTSVAPALPAVFSALAIELKSERCMHAELCHMYDE